MKRLMALSQRTEGERRLSFFSFVTAKVLSAFFYFVPYEKGRRSLFSRRTKRATVFFFVSSKGSSFFYLATYDLSYAGPIDRGRG